MIDQPRRGLPQDSNNPLRPFDLAQWLTTLGTGAGVGVGFGIGVDMGTKAGAGHAAPRPARWRSSDITRRAAAYLAKIPPAVSGERGHDRTFQVACALIKGFDLRIEEARPLLDAWNSQGVPPWSPRELQHKLQSADQTPDRRPRGYLLEHQAFSDQAGSPDHSFSNISPYQGGTQGVSSGRARSQGTPSNSPFVKGSVDKKRDGSARRGSPDPAEPVDRRSPDGGPRFASTHPTKSNSDSTELVDRRSPGGGSRFASAQSTESHSAPAEASDNRTPHALAERYLEQRHTHEGELGLRYWRDEFHAWNGSTYRPVPAGELRADLSRFLAAEFAELHLRACRDAAFPSPDASGRSDRSSRSPRPVPVTRNLVSDVTQALASLVLLPVEVYPNQPTWIEDENEETTSPSASWPLQEILPARNMLVHLPSYVSSPEYPLSSWGEARDEEDVETETPRWSLPPTPRLFQSSALNYDFEPQAPPPLAWLDFLERIWGNDRGSIACLQEWFGYLLHGDTRQQKILMMVGPKRSGRGTIARVLKALAGASNVVNPTLTTLSRPFGLASLIGKPIAVFPDARLSGRPDNAAIVECLLSISGEDDQTIDRKHLPSWTGRLPTRFVLISNELPKLRDASGALSSRLIILRFTNSFYGNEDTTLIDRLLAELPGILLWSIQGWDRLRKRGRLLQPRSAMELVDTMNDLASPIAAFLRDRCILEPSATVAVAELYRTWRDWCAGRGKEITGDEHSFGRDLHAAIPSLTKTRPRAESGGRVLFYKGVRLRSPADPDYEEDTF